MLPLIISDQKERLALEALLENYKEIFKEPNRLPPIKTYDHAIPIKEGAQPINLRPYRYFEGAKRHCKRWLRKCLSLELSNKATTICFPSCFG